MIEDLNPLLPRESYELSRLLLITRDAIRKVRNKELTQYNVQSNRVSLMLAIDALKDNATPVAIGKYLLRERHSISELLSRAEKDGLVEKKWDMERKNGVRVVLTSKGREISRRSGERRSIHAVMSALTPREAERITILPGHIARLHPQKAKLKINGSRTSNRRPGLRIVWATHQHHGSNLKGPSEGIE